jgi:hypothetical protein
MNRKIASLSLALLFASALTVLAQSPTTSAPTGQGATQDPYGATMDHPNPGSVAAPSSATSSNSTATSSTAATDDSTQNNSSTSTATTPSATTTTTTTTSSSTDTSNNSTDAATTPSSMPKTGSDLPLLFAIGCLALAGACGLRAARGRV